VNQRLASSFFALALASSGTVQADNDYDPSYVDTARVISVKPVYRLVEVSVPYEECWDEKIAGSSHTYRARDSYVAPIAGAIVGGVIGNQFGGGSGKDALTVGGALLGAAIGDNVRKTPRRHSSPRYEQRCSTTYETNTREELDGYKVKYRYNGEVFHTRMPYDPGDSIRLRVSITPLD
jgi:uncharacterized protein YcfJ